MFNEKEKSLPCTFSKESPFYYKNVCIDILFVFAFKHLCKNT